MKGIVLALVLHNQMCSHCYNGEPCEDAERLHDKWLEQIARAALDPRDDQDMAAAA
jgi:hypothetical protein